MIQKRKNKLTFPNGISNFEKLVNDNDYYVDKTSYISWFSPTFSQLTFNKDSIWDYRRGVIDLNHKAAIVEPPRLMPEPDLGSLWKHIDSIGVRRLQSQSIVTASIKRNGRLYKLDEELFDQVLLSITDGTGYVFELFNQTGERGYYYYEPIRVSENIKQSKEEWSSPEHHQVAAIIQVIDAEVQHQEVSRLLLELWQKNKN